MKMYKYPKIGQFRNVVKAIKSQWCFIGLDENDDPIYRNECEVDFPIIKFVGQVKLHGTNAAIGYDKTTDTIWCQSRSRVLTNTSDNAGFWSWVNDPTRLSQLKREFNRMTNISDDEYVVVYGEFCGEGIQKGVAISELKKMFVIFDTKYVDKNDSEIIKYAPPFNIGNDSGIDGVYHIGQFQTFEIEVDFNTPNDYVNQLIDITNEVERECPVGTHFGVNGVGEGVVWKAINPRDDTQLRFKVKGEKHSTSKVKKLVEVDPVKLASITEFVDYALTDNRLKQGIQVVFTEENLELDMKHTGAFIKWIDRDIFTEEQDVLLESNLTPNDVVKEINYKAVRWLKSKIFNDL